MGLRIGQDGYADLEDLLGLIQERVPCDPSGPKGFRHLMVNNKEFSHE